MVPLKKWHEAFKIINNDIHAEVLCPGCAESFLKIEDILDEEGNLDKRGLYALNAEKSNIS